MAPLDSAEFQRWRANGEAALAGARAQRDAGVHQWACFNCEQAAQLSLKALLHGVGLGPWGHDLLELVNKAVDGGFEIPNSIDDALRRLDRFYIQTRYPDAYAAGELATRYRTQDADQAIEDAETVLAWVDKTWESLS
jgi:HEPN domain-containing protein